MQKEAKQVDVIALSNVDPQTAVLAINKLFGGTGEEPDPKAPRVDADITTRSLLVRGTAGQVEQIRDLLRKMGETEEESGGTSNRDNMCDCCRCRARPPARRFADRADLAERAARTHSHRHADGGDSQLSARATDSRQSDNRPQEAAAGGAG